jgi:hypothetical protein
MNTKDLLHDQDDRKRSARGRHRPIPRDFAVLDGNLDFASFEVRRVGRNCLGGNRLDRKCEPGGQARHDEIPPCEIHFGNQTRQFLVHGSNSFKDEKLRSWLGPDA